MEDLNINESNLLIINSKELNGLHIGLFLLDIYGCERTPIYMIKDIYGGFKHKRNKFADTLVYLY